MELKQIEAFLMIVEKESFSEAADALYITQPTISLRIRTLEEELGTPLFHRNTGRKILLTPAGTQILPYFQEALQSIKKGQALLQQKNSKEKIVIACPNHMSVDIVPEVLEKLYLVYSDKDFSIEIMRTPEIVKSINDHQVDIGFVYIPQEDIYKYSNLIHIANAETVLISAPDHPLTKKHSISIEDLEQENLLVYNRLFLTTKLIEKYLQKKQLKIHKKIEITQLGWLKRMVRKGLGVAFVQKITVEDELRNNKLVKLPLTDALPPTPIHLLYNRAIDENLIELIVETAKTSIESRKQQ